MSQPHRPDDSPTAGEGWLSATPPTDEQAPDRYYRVRRTQLPGFQRVGRRLVATEAVSAREDRGGAALRLLKGTLIGRPLDSERLEAERLPVAKALPILSSDPLSSVAYGPEAGLVVLAGAGAGALIYSVPIAVAVAALMVVVTASYVQVVRGYQRGGGSYAVAAANLGRSLGLVAAAALLVDYVLTVSVSISSGVEALISTVGALEPYKVGLALALVAVLMLGNLRGVREAGHLFAGPTYVFVGCLLLLIVIGLFGFIGGHHALARYAPLRPRESLTAVLVLIAFASACASMTGIESISNSVPVFKPPVGRNAARTLVILGALLVIMFLGVIALDVVYAAEPRPNGNPTVLAQLAADVFTGPARPLFYLTQLATLAVLVLAANASFNGFPRLAAILARDDFLPHRFGQLGNRLVYSTAIVMLTLAGSVLIIVFSGNVDELINLYALGVFTAFTLAQLGMARHWWRARDRGWRMSLTINGIGAATTGLVDLVIIYTKTPRGAWLVLVVVPLLMALFFAVNRHYRRTRELLAHTDLAPGDFGSGPVIVPIHHAGAPARSALAYARALGLEVRAIHVARNEGEALDFLSRWRSVPEAEIEVVIARRPISAFTRIVDKMAAAYPTRWITVVLPEAQQPLWHELLRHPRIVVLKLELLLRPGVVVCSLPAAEKEQPPAIPASRITALVPVARIDAPTAKALSYAADHAQQLVAVHVTREEPELSEATALRSLRSDFRSWIEAHGLASRASLVVIESPYRAVAEPLLYYFLAWERADPHSLCTVVLPELVDLRPWTVMLHNHRAFWLKAMLLRHSTLAVADVTYRLPRKRPPAATQAVQAAGA